jgi:hypothetical protein
MVLLIDDKQSITTMMHKRLLLCGIESDVAHSFGECQKLFDNGNRYKVIVADYNLNNGATGLNIIQMYTGIDPEVFSILYSAAIIDEKLPLACVDKVYSKCGDSLDALINLIMSICSEKLQPRVLAKIFELIQVVDNKLATVIEVHIPAVQARDLQIDDFMKKVDRYIESGKHDIWRVIAALAILIGLATALLKLS